MSEAPPLRVQIFQWPKMGCTRAEIEDAAAADGARGLLAIADGATDSAFQRLWAAQLCDAYVTDPPAATGCEELLAWLTPWLAERRAAWHAAIDWASIPWHGWMKAQQTGALSTYLAISLETAPDAEGARPFSALAVGDCALFHVDAQGALLRAWPLNDPALYGNAPFALSSLRPLPEDACTRGILLRREGLLRAGESLLLTTDALALWVLRTLALGETPLSRLAAVADEEAFGALVEELRRDHLLRDDDCTLLLAQTT